MAMMMNPFKRKRTFAQIKETQKLLNKTLCMQRIETDSQIFANLLLKGISKCIASLIIEKRNLMNSIGIGQALLQIYVIDEKIENLYQRFHLTVPNYLEKLFFSCKKIFYKGHEEVSKKPCSLHVYLPFEEDFNSHFISFCVLLKEIHSYIPCEECIVPCLDCCKRVGSKRLRYTFHSQATKRRDWSNQTIIMDSNMIRFEISRIWQLEEKYLIAWFPKEILDDIMESIKNTNDYVCPKKSSSK